MNASDCIFIGSNGRGSAIDKNNGKTLWETRLKKGIFSAGTVVTLLVEDGRIFAHTYGDLFCLDAEAGDILWTNDLPGLGYDVACLATQTRASSVAPAAVQRAAAQAGAAAATV